ncbi:uncharacterized protein hubl [Drosophila kikkawai]|uniref:Uncharacterized protein hubl n=1 Tax=Drosophila kikkawai TaxID=30033 RepID=A0A6P4I2N9_DROKI|nr:uncharacterized protein LOC108070844 [Drosophila kikkawai]
MYTFRTTSSPIRKSKLNPPAMLISMAKKMVCMSSLKDPTTLARIFHHSSVMAQKKDQRIRYAKPCPESEVPNSKVLNRKPCSPTELVGPCNEGDCSETMVPPCVNKRISESPCTPSVNSKDFKKPRHPFNSMWESYKGKKYAPPVVEWDYPKEICCPDCEDVRFDLLYYTPSKKSRNYQRTWWECSPRMVPKRVCCWCDAVPPQVQRRTVKPQCATSVCNNEHERMRLECLNKNFKGCPRWQMPCCRASRHPPNCKVYPTPSDCVKTKCPFPSYSECLQEEPADIPGRAPECTCLKRPPDCLILRRADHMAKNKNIRVNPCLSREAEP